MLGTRGNFHFLSYHNLRSENPENIVTEEPCQQNSGRRKAGDTDQPDALGKQKKTRGEVQEKRRGTGRDVVTQGPRRRLQRGNRNGRKSHNLCTGTRTTIVDADRKLKTERGVLRLTTHFVGDITQNSQKRANKSRSSETKQKNPAEMCQRCSGPFGKLRECCRAAV